MKSAAAVAVALLALALVSSGAGAVQGQQLGVDRQPTPAPERWVLIAPSLRKSIGVYPSKEACLKKIGGLHGSGPLDASCVSEHDLEHGLHHHIGSLPIMMR